MTRLAALGRHALALGLACLACLATGLVPPAAASAAARQSPASPEPARVLASPSPRPSGGHPSGGHPVAHHPAASSPLSPASVAPPPTPGCHPRARPVGHIAREPWAQRALAVADVWRLTRGQGVTVAVVDSGVDYSPQLAGRVTAITLKDGYGDCAGHGTAVAGIIAAGDRREQGIPFTGVAPGAHILSVKVNQGDKGRLGVLAQGIRDAATLGAQVINVSVTTHASPVLLAAVRYALGRGAVIVAAAGNDTQAGNGTPASKGPFYPASYPGVLSVGAVTPGGALASFSDQRSGAAVTAPGLDVTSIWPGGYQEKLEGTSFATAFVSGVAALVRARYPRLSPAQVVYRIEATADGRAGPGTGAGLVNPLEAVTAILPGTTSGSQPPGTPEPVSVATARAAPHLPIAASLGIAAGALAGALMVALGAVTISRGKRRRWRAARAEIPAGEPRWPATPAEILDEDPWGAGRAGRA